MSDFIQYTFKPLMQAAGATLQDAGVALLASAPDAVGGVSALLGWKNNPLSTGAQYLRENLRSDYGREVAKNGDNIAYQALEFAPTAAAGSGVAKAVSKLPRVAAKVSPLMAGIGTEAAIGAGQDYAGAAEDATWIGTVPYSFAKSFAFNSFGTYASKFIPNYTTGITKKVNYEEPVKVGNIRLDRNYREWIKKNNLPVKQQRELEKQGFQKVPDWESLTLGELSENVPPEILELILKYTPKSAYAENNLIPGD